MTASVSSSQLWAVSSPLFADEEALLRLSQLSQRLFAGDVLGLILGHPQADLRHIAMSGVEAQSFWALR